MTEDREKIHLQILGARILSEANDLKRTPEALAAELNLSIDQMRDVIAGQADRETACGVLHRMSEVYPVSIADLWVEYDDTDDGVRIVTSADSVASGRVFDRLDRDGGFSPYYEYRDTAMSRVAPFKPEWIKELRVVSNAEPDNPDVAYNHGHLMHQTTFFVGPVNFYWEINEQRHCVEMNTGDSNYITPFIPHSFTSREEGNLGLILAVTYGGAVRSALSEFGRTDAEALEGLIADPRQPDAAFVQRLKNHAAAESLNNEQLIERLVHAGFDKVRARTLVTNGGPTVNELEAISEALNIRPADLAVSPLTEDEEVVVKRRRGTAKRDYPNSDRPAYELTELARSKHQPLLKGFDVAVVGGDNGTMQHGLHEYIYNYGDEPTELFWGEGHQSTLLPGDSAYVRPMVAHRFQPAQGAQAGRLIMIRVPSALNGTAMEELSTFAPQGRQRVARETRRWF